jgi:hypothetical protein
MLLVLTLFSAQLQQLGAVEVDITQMVAHHKLVAQAVLAVVVLVVLALVVLALQIKGLMVALVMLAHSLQAAAVAGRVRLAAQQSLMALAALAARVLLLQLLVHQ